MIAVVNRRSYGSAYMAVRSRLQQEKRTRVDIDIAVGVVGVCAPPALGPTAKYGNAAIDVAERRSGAVAECRSHGLLRCHNELGECVHKQLHTQPETAVGNVGSGNKSGLLAGGQFDPLVRRVHTRVRCNEQLHSRGKRPLASLNGVGQLYVRASRLGDRVERSKVVHDVNQAVR